MIKPFTAVCMLAAGASGLYLYQTKHRAAMLDKQIMGVLRQTAETRERIGALRADWSRLNEQEWLAELSSKHLGLRKLAPTQFISLADLGSRLPPPLPAGTLVVSNDEGPAVPAVAAPAGQAPGAVPPGAVTPGAATPGAMTPGAGAPAVSAQAAPAVPATPPTPMPTRMAARPAQPAATGQAGSGQVGAGQVGTAIAGPAVQASTAPRAVRPARPEGRDEAAAPATPARVAQAPVQRAPVVSVAVAPIHVAAAPPVEAARAVARVMPQPAYAAQTVATPGGYAPGFPAGQPALVQSALGQSALGGARPSLPPPVPYGAQPR